MNRSFVIEFVTDASGAVTGVRSLNGEVLQLDQSLERTMGTASRFGQTMSTAFSTTTTTASRELVQSLSDTQRQAKLTNNALGQMGRGGRPARDFLFELSRGAEDAAYGMRGVINQGEGLVRNWGRLVQEAGGVRGALKAIMANLGGPAGLLFLFNAATTAAILFGDKLVSAFGRSADAADEAKESYDAALESMLKVETETQTYTLRSAEAAERLKGDAEAQLETLREAERVQRTIVADMQTSEFGADPDALAEARSELDATRESIGEYEIVADQAGRALKRFNAEARATEMLDAAGLTPDEDPAAERLRKRLEREAAQRAQVIRETEYELRALRIELMDEGAARVVAETELAFDQRMDALAREYPQLRAFIEENERALRTQAVSAALDAAAGIDLPNLDAQLKAMLPKIEPQEIVDSDGLAVEVGRVRALLAADLVDSLGEVEDALDVLGQAYDAATSDEERAKLEALILLFEKLERAMQRTKDAALDVGPALQDGLGNAIYDLSEALGEALAGLEDTEATISERLLLSLAGTAKQIGSLMIGFGVAALALRTLLTNPLTAIAAGAALVALGSFAQRSIQNAISDRVEAEREEARGTRPNRSDVAAGIPARAAGGPVSSGRPYLVGERGPELVVPDAPGYVLPADVTSALLGGAGSGYGSRGVDVRSYASVENMRARVDWFEVDYQLRQVQQVQREAFGR